MPKPHVMKIGLFKRIGVTPTKKMLEGHIKKRYGELSKHGMNPIVKEP
jgi:hypothetical protein